MIYRRFGKTELQMPLITCGGMRFQHGWDDIDLSKVPPEVQKNLEDCVHYALDRGINHFETARGYGPSELQLGLVLPNIDRDRLIVQTKVNPEGGPKKFAEDFERSMSLLKLDHVDLLGIHGINNAQVLEQAKSCFDQIEQYKKEGRINNIGFSTHGDPKTILDAVKTGFFDYINVHWYYVNHLNWPAIQEATRRDMGVFIISPNDKGGKLYEPPKKLAKLCGDLNPMQFNDLYCWSRPEVHTLSMGVSRPQDFDTHIDALSKLDNADQLVAPIDQAIRKCVAEAIHPDWQDNWDQGIPEWETLPNGIHVKEIIRLYTWAKALDMVEFGKMRYNLLGNAGHWFPGHKYSDHNKAEMKAALSQSPFADIIPDILEEAHALLNAEEVKRLSESD